MFPPHTLFPDKSLLCLTAIQKKWETFDNKYMKPFFGGSTPQRGLLDSAGKGYIV